MVQKINSNRGTDDDTAIQTRLKIAEEEIKFQRENSDFFDKVILNDDLETAYKDLKEFLKEDIESYASNKGGSA
jgi:guanylate kinase